MDEHEPGRSDLGDCGVGGDRAARGAHVADAGDYDDAAHHRPGVRSPQSDDVGLAIAFFLAFGALYYYNLR